MTRIEFAAEVVADFDRILDHLLRHETRHAAARVGLIVGALDILRDHPLVGRVVRTDLRELVIGRGARGYVALYRYVPQADTAFVLAVRSQREAGYPDR